MAKCKIFDLQTDAQTLQIATNTIVDWASQSNQKYYVSACTVYGLMKSQENHNILEAFNGADMVIADGMPIRWLQRVSGFQNAERVYGPDLLLGVCKATQQRPIRHFFWGGLPDVADQLAAQLHQQFSGLQIAGVHSPPVEELPSEPHKEVVAHLNASQADIVWVGLGSPKQDLWMQLYRPHLEAPVLIGVGAAFDFLSGNKRQAPRIVQRLGLEWLFRLLQEPRRLWKRYLVYNTKFVCRVGWLIVARVFGRKENT